LGASEPRARPAIVRSQPGACELVQYKRVHSQHIDVRKFAAKSSGRAGTHAFDLTLMKQFHMPYNENHSLEFRAEAFNAFNTPQYSNPDANLGDTAFGQVTSTKLDNREMQLALKYIF
jgi:hypothetical protein